MDEKKVNKEKFFNRKKNSIHLFDKGNPVKRHAPVKRQTSMATSVKTSAIWRWGMGNKHTGRFFNGRGESNRFKRNKVNIERKKERERGEIRRKT